MSSSSTTTVGCCADTTAAMDHVSPIRDDVTHERHLLFITAPPVNAYRERRDRGARGARPKVRELSPEHGDLQTIERSGEVHRRVHPDAHNGFRRARDVLDLRGR